MSSFLARRSIGAAPRAAARAFSTTAARPLSRIQLIGNLADAPELHTTSSGREIVKYTVATNFGTKEDRKTSWFKVSSFVNEGPRKDFLMGLTKGSMVYVDGDALLQTYEDGDGKLRSALNITQRNLEILKRSTSDPQQQQQQEEE